MPTPRKGYANASGEKVPSVTTICSTLGWGTEALQWWAWDMGRRGFEYKTMRQSAASVGTVVHDRIHAHLVGQAWDSSQFDPQDIAASDDPFDLYLRWREQQEIEILLAEKHLVSERHGYGGTPDFLMLLNGVVTEVDLKTSSGVYASHLVQVAAYKALIEEVEEDSFLEHAEAIEDVMILQIGRDGSFEPKAIPPKIISEGLGIFWHLLDIHKRKPLFDKFCAKPKKAKKAEESATVTQAWDHANGGPVMVVRPEAGDDDPENAGAP